MSGNSTERMSAAVARMTATVQKLRAQVTGGGATVKTVPQPRRTSPAPEVTDWIPLRSMTVHEAHCVGAGCACSKDGVRP